MLILNKVLMVVKQAGYEVQNSWTKSRHLHTYQTIISIVFPICKFIYIYLYVIIHKGFPSL